MIEHDAPAVDSFAKEQSEAPVRPIVFALQSPTSEHHGRIGRQRRDLEIGKSERPHLRAIGIFFPVTIAHRFPAASQRIF